MKLGKLIVDGTKEVIADGRKAEMHAICKETDYTHMRVVGYARDLAQAHRFAASDDLLAAAQNTVTEFKRYIHEGFTGISFAGLSAEIQQLNTAIARATGEA